MVTLSTRTLKRALRRTAGAGVLLAGLVPGVAVSGTFAHARPIIPTVCPACRLAWPAIAITSGLLPAAGATNPSPAPSLASIDIAGSNFTSGGAVHVELLATADGSVMAEGDTTAGLALTLPLGNNHFVHVPGGDFTLSLIPSPSSPDLCAQVSSAQIVAVDEATGLQATSQTLDPLAWWSTNAPGYSTASCVDPTVPAVAPPSLTAANQDGTLSISGSNFVPNGAVTVEFSDPGQFDVTVQAVADAAGNVTLLWSPPDGCTSDVVSITATSAATGQSATTTAVPSCGG
jgi:hypothetical protein